MELENLILNLLQASNYNETIESVIPGCDHSGNWNGIAVVQFKTRYMAHKLVQNSNGSASLRGYKTSFIYSQNASEFLYEQADYSYSIQQNEYQKLEPPPGAIPDHEFYTDPYTGYCQDIQSKLFYDYSSGYYFDGQGSFFYVDPETKTYIQYSTNEQKVEENQVEKNQAQEISNQPDYNNQIIQNDEFNKDSSLVENQDLNQIEESKIENQINPEKNIKISFSFKNTQAKRSNLINSALTTPKITQEPIRPIRGSRHFIDPKLQNNHNQIGIFIPYSINNICLLCRRILSNREMLLRHSKESKLHQKNLEALELKNNKESNEELVEPINFDDNWEEKKIESMKSKI